MEAEVGEMHFEDRVRRSCAKGYRRVRVRIKICKRLSQPLLVVKMEGSHEPRVVDSL